jgi:hypothetical protein
VGLYASEVSNVERLKQEIYFILTSWLGSLQVHNTDTQSQPSKDKQCVTGKQTQFDTHSQQLLNSDTSTT